MSIWWSNVFGGCSMTFVDSCFLFLRVFKRICLQFASYKSLGHGASSRNHTRSSSSIKPSRRISTASKNPRINDRVLIWSAVFIDCMILSAGCSCRKWFWHPCIYMHLLYSEVYPRHRKIVPATSHSKLQDICKPQCNEVCFPLQQGGWDENSSNPPAKTSRRMFYRACILIFFSNPWLAGICSNFLVSEFVFFWSMSWIPWGSFNPILRGISWTCIFQNRLLQDAVFLRNLYFPTGQLKKNWTFLHAVKKILQRSIKC